MHRITQRQEQLSKLRRRYAGRGREGKSRLLDEFCAHYEYDRKYAIKLLAPLDSMADQALRPGPDPKYEPVAEVLWTIWRVAEQLCGKRLVEALPLWLPHYEHHYGKIPSHQKRLLAEVSAATVDRLLAEEKAQWPHGLSATRPGTLLRQQVPIQGEVWNEKRVGFLEADSVAHCGSSLAGNFTWSLTYTDLASSWTEGRAVWNRGASGVLERTEDVEKMLPFAILGFDFDNGSEWLNWNLIRYLQVRARPVRLTRSRPYHKDDNAHVEQKNWMWPRQLLGYQRLEEEALVEPINRLYKEVWGPLHNFFLPSMKLKEKWREGSRWVRRHDRPQTAYQRLLASGQLRAAQKRELRDRYHSLDPFELAAELEKRLKKYCRRRMPKLGENNGSRGRAGGAPQKRDPGARSRPRAQARKASACSGATPFLDRAPCPPPEKLGCHFNMRQRMRKTDCYTVSFPREATSVFVPAFWSAVRSLRSSAFSRQNH